MAVWGGASRVTGVRGGPQGGLFGFKFSSRAHPRKFGLKRFLAVRKCWRGSRVACFWVTSFRKKFIGSRGEAPCVASVSWRGPATRCIPFGKGPVRRRRNVVESPGMNLTRDRFPQLPSSAYRAAVEQEIRKRGNSIESMLPAADPATTWDKDEAYIRQRLSPAPTKLEAPRWRCWISRRTRRSL